MFKNYNKQKEANTIVSPINGTFVPINDVQDPIFSQQLLGKGFAVLPSDGLIKAPIDGKITITSDSKHIVGIKSEYGYSVLIHVGLGTVSLGGQGFEYFINEDQVVKKGENLLRFDLDLVKEKAFSSLVLIMITNIEKNEVNLGWHDVDTLIAGETSIVNVVF